MRIQHNIPALNSYRNYKNNNSVLNKNLEKLSSGYKINRSGDDAAGLAISEKMRAQITSLQVAQKNAKDGIGMIQSAEGALTEVHSMLNRMVELRQQADDATYAAQDKENLDLEFKELTKEISRILGQTSFNGTKVFDGSMGTGFNTDDNGGTMTLQFSTIKVTGDTNSGFTTSFTTTLAAALTFSTLVKGFAGSSSWAGVSETTGLSMFVGSKASSGLKSGVSTQAIKHAINVVSAYRAMLGAGQNRLEHTINNLSVLQENVSDAESSIRDTDVAEEMMRYTKNSIMIQSAQAMLAQANQQPQGVLQLLQ